ncbi:MAG: flavodoxin reductase [Chitinophagaceae bacterium]|nr:flavodoxin reductase [Chitinophagaceae bacterium]
MESHIVKLLDIKPVTHDVLGLKVEKPANYSFNPGQATEVAINDGDWKNERRPFTFTNLPDDDHLEFTIKTYPERSGVTNHLRDLKKGDELIIHDVWGAISYKGKGLFIAGGAGLTPFLSIFRYLNSKNEVSGNRLLFANKMKKDIILEAELNKILEGRVTNVLSGENIPGYKHGFITEELLREVSIQPGDKIYLCGPPPMMDAVLKILDNLGRSGESVVMEI